MPTHFPIVTAHQLSTYVRALRKARGFTQTDVAKRLGVSKMRVATIEKDVGRVSMSRLMELLQILDGRLVLTTDANVDSTADSPTLLATNSTPPGRGAAARRVRKRDGDEW